MFRNMSEWIETFRSRKAIFLHDRNPDRPHPLLSGEDHSDSFFNSELVTQDPILMEEAVSDLVSLLHSTGCDLKRPDRVVGPAMGAIVLAHDIARHIGHLRTRRCLSSYTEKKPDGVMRFGRTQITPGEIVLLCEDTVTRGKSLEKTAKAVEDAGGILMPYVMVLMNRSDLKEVGGRKILALADHPMPIWKPEQEGCELCNLGSRAIRPKTPPENWQRLNAEYR